METTETKTLPDKEIPVSLGKSDLLLLMEHMRLHKFKVEPLSGQDGVFDFEAPNGLKGFVDAMDGQGFTFIFPRHAKDGKNLKSPELLELINELNSNSLHVQFSVDKGGWFVARAYYWADYVPRLVCHFLGVWQSDAMEEIAKVQATLEKYFDFQNNEDFFKSAGPELVTPEDGAKTKNEPPHPFSARSMGDAASRDWIVVDRLRAQVESNEEISNFSKIVLAYADGDDSLREKLIAKLDPVASLAIFPVNVRNQMEDNGVTLKEAVEEVATMVDMMYAVVGSKHPLHIAAALSALGQLYSLGGRWAEAEPLLIAAATIAEANLPWGKKLATFVSPLVDLFYRSAGTEKAEAWAKLIAEMRAADDMVA